MKTTRDSDAYHNDDEPTVHPKAQGAVDEATVSAKVDVRAMFADSDTTEPGLGSPAKAEATDSAFVEEIPPFERTLPMVRPEDLQGASAPALHRPVTEPLPMTPVLSRTAPLAPANVPAPTSSASSLEQGPPSEPRLFRASSASDDDDDADYVVPGLAAQRKRMQKIVFGVVGVCGLLCLGAIARQLLWPDSKDSETRPVPTATAAATATTTATATATATETAAAIPGTSAAPVPDPPPIASASAAPAPTAPSAEPPRPAEPPPTASAAPPAPPPEPPPAPPPAPPATLAAPAPEPPPAPPPAPPPHATAAPVVHNPPAHRPASPPPPPPPPAKPVTGIVRDNPF